MDALKVILQVKLFITQYRSVPSKSRVHFFQFAVVGSTFLKVANCSHGMFRHSSLRTNTLAQYRNVIFFFYLSFMIENHGRKYF